MTENVVEPTREELEAKLAEMDAKLTAAEVSRGELSTRDRSPVKPQDHKPKAENLLDSTQTVTYKGESFEVDFAGLDDADLFGQDQSNPFVQAQAVKNVLGDEGYLRLCDLVRDESGRARATKVQEAFGEIMQSVDLKNS